MKDFRYALHEMDNDSELKEQVEAAAKEVTNILRAHKDEFNALMSAVTRCYIEFCDKYNIEREEGMMMLHAEQLFYLVNLDIDSIPPLDQED